MLTIDICKDFPDWPNRWSLVNDDLSFSKELLETFEEFVVHLDKSGLKKKTIRRHMDNLWQLGGELVRRINIDDKYNISPKDHLLEQIDEEGGPYCRHLVTEEDFRSYDATCKKLYKFLQKVSGGG